MENKQLNREKLRSHDEPGQKKQDNKVTAFIQMLAIKSDTNMTRIYSAIENSKKREEYS